MKLSPALLPKVRLAAITRGPLGSIIVAGGRIISCMRCEGKFRC